MRCRCHFLHLVNCLDKTSLAVEHHSDDGDDASEHDNALDEVVDGCGLITAQNHIDGSEECHEDDAVFVWNAEAHVEKFGDSAIDTSRVGNEEHESDDGRSDAQSLIGKSGAEKVWHGARVDVLGHQFGATTEDNPCKERTNDGVANTNP